MVEDVLLERVQPFGERPRLCGRRRCVRRDGDVFERLDRVLDAVFEQLNLVRAKVSDRLSVFRRVQIDADRLDAGSKRRRLHGGRRFVLRRCRSDGNG